MAKIRQSNFLHLFCVSHRGLHFVCGLLLGLVCGLDAAVVVAAALEAKDCQNDRLNAPYGLDFRKWTWRCLDWWDFGLTVAGGLVGSVLRWLAIGWFM